MESWFDIGLKTVRHRFESGSSTVRDCRSTGNIAVLGIEITLLLGSKLVQNRDIKSRLLAFSQARVF